MLVPVTSYTGKKLAVQIVVDGSPLPMYTHPLNGGHYVCGKPGTRYYLHIQNVTDPNEDIKVFTFVDGLNLLEQEPRVNHNFNGKALAVEGNDVETVKGWMIKNRWREMLFAPKGDTASLADVPNAAQIGTIKFGVFVRLKEEANEELTSKQVLRSSSGDLGTTVGDVIEGALPEGGEFGEIDPNDIELLNIWYATAEWLEAAGFVPMMVETEEPASDPVEA